jgi:hypothetical protein
MRLHPAARTKVARNLPCQTGSIRLPSVGLRCDHIPKRLSTSQKCRSGAPNLRPVDNQRHASLRPVLWTKVGVQIEERAAIREGGSITIVLITLGWQSFGKDDVVAVEFDMPDHAAPARSLSH